MRDPTTTVLPGAEPLTYRVVGLAVLVLGWVQFMGIWLWPPVPELDWSAEWGVVDTQVGKPGAVLLQYPLWLLICAGVGLAVLRRGLSLARHLMPFNGLLALMLVASVFGISMMASTRITVLWMLSVLAGMVVATLLDRQMLFRTLGAIILVTMALSLASFVLMPEHGADRYRAEFVLRGLFSHKNTAGRVAALSLALLFVMRRDLPSRLLYPAALASASCLILASSKTAWLSAMLAVGYLALVDQLRRRVSAGLGSLIVAATVLLLTLAAVAAAAPLAEAMGRDLTFTGRTDIWSAYMNEIQHLLWLGAGPGNLTMPSPLTAKISLELRAHGSIFSPHSFYIGTLGDLGLAGLAATLALLVFVTLWRPLDDRGAFALGMAAVGISTLIGGLGETLDAAQPGSTWFLLGLFWIGHCLEREEGQRAALAAPRPAVA